MPLAGRRAVAVDEPGRAPGEHRRELAGVPDRRRAADDDRVAAVVGADPEQPAQDVGDVPAEHAAVRVQLVDDDDLELLEQLEPLRVVGQDRRVEHVRVGHDDLAGGPDGRPDRAPACRRRRSRPRSAARPPPTAPPNSATWSWPSALVGNRKSARDAGSSAMAWRIGQRVAQRSCPTRSGVTTTTSSPAWTASIASAWWRVRPLDAARARGRPRSAGPASPGTSP